MGRKPSRTCSLTTRFRERNGSGYPLLSVVAKSCGLPDLRSARASGPRRTSPKDLFSRRSAAASALDVAALLVAAPGASTHAGHGPVEIDIADYAYAPQQVQVYQGDSVVFTWKGPDTNHSATADDGSFETGSNHALGDTYGVSFTKAGPCR